MFTMFTSKSVEFRSSDLRRNVLTILTLVQFLNLSAFRRSLVLFPVDIKAANLKSHPLSHSNKTFETSNLNIDKPYNWYNNSYILYNLSISIYIYIYHTTNNNQKINLQKQKVDFAWFAVAQIRQRCTRMVCLTFSGHAHLFGVSHDAVDAGFLAWKRADLVSKHVTFCARKTLQRSQLMSQSCIRPSNVAHKTPYSTKIC